MYCIECGGQIPEDSKYCSHCGKQQTEGEPSVKEKIAEKIIETEIVRQEVEEHKKSLDYDFLRKAMVWYLAWIVLHLGILLIASEDIFANGSSSDGFWPFSGGIYIKSYIGQYDIREFLFYTFFPLSILIIWSMLRSQSDSSEEEKGK